VRKENVLFKVSNTQQVRSTGTTPSEFLIRWDAPSDQNVAILEIFCQQSFDINVLVSDDPYKKFILVPKFSDRYPNLADPAGSNTRDPQKRPVTVVLRGGPRRFYRFRQIPVVAVTMKLDLPFSTFVGSSFIANMAMLLGISRNRIKIASVRSGSTVVDFTTEPNNTMAANKSEVANQVADLQSVTVTLSSAIASGAFEETVAPVLTCAAAVSHVDILDPYDNKKEYPANATLNSTLLRQEAVSATIPVPVFLASYPTSQPSQQPIGFPSYQPTKQPYYYPTNQPSKQPNQFPTCQPVSFPSSRPSGQPADKPSRQPVLKPTQQPSKQPFKFPTSQPSKQPAMRPSSQPSC